MDLGNPVDVRIIVEGASDVESVSKAMQNIALGAEYNITISSIIPTTSVEVAKRAVKGADIVLIATDVDAAGRELAEKLKMNLMDEAGHIERMKFPFGHDVEYIDPSLIGDEIKNAIIRAGLSSIAHIERLRNLENNLKELKEKQKGLFEENKNLSIENEELSIRCQELKEASQKLEVEAKTLRDEFRDINEKYAEIKTEYEDIKNKELFQVFSIHDIWKEAFDDELKNEKQV